MEPENDTSPYPEIKGRIWVRPEIDDGHEISVWIGGDPDGLRSFGELMIFLAEADQRREGVPDGEHDHFNLFPKGLHGQSYGLAGGSCTVEICRADAAGTGEIYPHLLEADLEADARVRDDEEAEPA
jgi:hypothetical protein